MTADSISKVLAVRVSDDLSSPEAGALDRYCWVSLAEELVEQNLGARPLLRSLHFPKGMVSVFLNCPVVTKAMTSERGVWAGTGP
jgi:hypothetical protein